VANGNVIVNDELEIRIILGDDAQHLGAGFQAFDDDHADVVLFVMDKQMGNTHFAFGSCGEAATPRPSVDGWRWVLIGLI
jgi:hypothetical protein